MRPQTLEEALAFDLFPILSSDWASARQAALWLTNDEAQRPVVSYYGPEPIEQLKRLCNATRVTQSVYLREELDDLLKKYTATLRKAAK